MRQPEVRHYDHYYRNYTFDGRAKEPLLRRLLNRDSANLNYLLFFLTFATTFLIGFQFEESVVNGIWYSTGIMFILLSHEMGHYVMCRRHGVDATLPFFIPFPPPNPFGTMGAVIRMKGRMPHRRALFDIGAGGPIAGLVITVPALIWGLTMSTVESIPETAEVQLFLGDSLLFKIIEQWIFGVIPEGQTVVLHPLAYAGWAGLFFTALNLLPIGQLDGGHVVYALFGEKSKFVFSSFLSVFALICIFYYLPWIIFLNLLLWFGFKHPPTLNPFVSLDRKRQIVGWAIFLFFVLSFIPQPFLIK